MKCDLRPDVNLRPMASAEKTAERRRKARAFRNLVRDLARVTQVYRPTAACILDFLGQAELNARNAEGGRLARAAFYEESPSGTLPEELSDKTISQYLAHAGEFFGNAATDYVLISDYARAYRYFRKAARHYRQAAEIEPQNGSALRKEAERYWAKTAIVRHELARRNIRKRRLGFRLPRRLRR